MSPTVKARRLRAMLERIARDRQGDLESLSTTPDQVKWPEEEEEEEGALEVLDPQREAAAKAQREQREQLVDTANLALRDLAAGKDISPAAAEALEAIVLLRDRPVTLVQQDDYADLGAPWTHLNTPEARARLTPALTSIGRVELPLRSDVPYGGTAFVVGKDLLMTNRHVAQAFTAGVGTRELRYTAGGAAIDFAQELARPGAGTRLEVRTVLMIHPFWDMTLLQVEGLSPDRPALKLSVKSPEELRNADAVVIGYPAPDRRNDSAAQRRIFKDTFYVKRLQPGKIRDRQRIESFRNLVPAMTHDASTLGGNSGSAIIEAATGHVIGLHFGGVYLRINYAVPMYELARDSRVVERLVFEGRVAPTDDWRSAWLRSEGGEAPAGGGAARPAGGGALQPPPLPVGGTTWTIPLTVTVSLGGAGAAAGPPPLAPEPPAPEPPAARALVLVPGVPFIADDLESRDGYQADFLGGGIRIELPKLTEAGQKIVSRLDGGSPELRYHRFSVVMHKKRRLALFTASNVDWRASRRWVNGWRPTRNDLTGLAEGQEERWVTDPRIPALHQLPDVFYTRDGGAFDKGHLVRRDDVAWGSSFQDMRKGNGDTYHTTNCSPQVASFNRSDEGRDNWGDLENLVEARTQAEKAIVFAGPVLDPEDSYFHGRDDRGTVSIQIPTRFWKIIVTRSATGPKAYGFVLEQDLSAVPTHDEMSVPLAWERHTAPIDEIEELLGGWASLDALRPLDQIESAEAAAIGARL